MSKEEIVSAIQNCARKLGRVPTRRELQKMNGVSHHEVDRRFGSYGRAVTQAGLKPERKHHEGIRRELLLADWARVARKVGKAPTRFEYIAEGAYSTTPFERHWRRWGQVSADFMRFAKEAGQEGLWEDVMEIAGNAKKTLSPQICADGKNIGIENQVLPQASAENADQKSAGNSTQHSAIGSQSQEPENLTADNTDLLRGVSEGGGPLRRKRRVLRDRPVYGAPAVHAGALGHVPINEAGVLVAFGMLAERLGLIVLRVQTDFPDCEVLCEMEPGRWQRLRVEFEFESRNFLRHGHDADGCDMIVCWKHNWPECPERIEVVELGRIIG